MYFDKINFSFLSKWQNLKYGELNFQDHIVPIHDDIDNKFERVISEEFSCMEMVGKY